MDGSNDRGPPRRLGVPESWFSTTRLGAWPRTIENAGNLYIQWYSGVRPVRGGCCDPRGGLCFVTPVDRAASSKNSLRNQFTDVSPSTSPCSFSGATLGNFPLNRLFWAEGPLLSRRPTLREGAALGRRGGQQRYAPPRAMRCHATCRAVLGYGWLCWAMGPMGWR